MFEFLIYLAAGLVAVLVPALYFWVHARRSRRSADVLARAVASGRDQPVSLHPLIDPAICIGSGGCVAACPEQNVLGLVNNRGTLINPANCIGHGMCQAACPVDAISLVFGTDKRGVDIPQLKGSFETNVPGCYIAGELGGMGLIKNATEQGRQAMQNLARSLNGERGKRAYDVAIVGAGPAGLAAALQAQQEGLAYILLDQEDFGGTVLTYPRGKLVMTRPLELPGYGKVKLREVSKEELVELFDDVVKKCELELEAGEKVTQVEKKDGHFVLRSDSREIEAARVLLAIGRRGTPRKLGCEGEKSEKVAYRLLDPKYHSGQRVLVVGGGDSAVEAALALAEQEGTTVHLSYRRERIFRIKEGNQQRLEEAFERGLITPLLPSEVRRIDTEQVLLEHDGEERSLPNDQVFIFAGGKLPTEFLEAIGIEFTRKFGEA